MKANLPKKLIAGVVSVAMLLVVALSPVFADVFQANANTDTQVQAINKSMYKDSVSQTSILQAEAPHVATMTTYTVGGATQDFPATAVGLQAAFATNANDYIIKLMDNIDLGSTQVLHAKNQTVTLDLNGYEIKITNTDVDNRNIAILVENMDLTINDSSVASTGKIIATGEAAVAVEISGYANDQYIGNLTINGGTIIGCISNYGDTVKIMGGTVYNIKKNGIAIHNLDGSVIVNGGVVTTSAENSYAIFNHLPGSTTTINGGTVSTTGVDSVGIFSFGGDEIIVNGGKIIAEKNSNGIKIQNGSATINGGTITADTGYAVADFTTDPNSDNFEDGNSITIAGGNVSEIGIALLEPDLTYEGKYASKFTAKNLNGAEIKLCELSGMDANAEILQFTTVPSYSYGINDTFTDENGKMFAWLPTNSVTGNNSTGITIVAGNKTYKGKIINGKADMKQMLDGHYDVSVTGGTSDVTSAKAGDTVKITANVPSGKIFKEWRVTPAVAFVNGTSKTSETAQFTMPSSDISAVAVCTNKSTNTTTGGSYGGSGTSTRTDYSGYITSGNGQIVEKNSGKSATFTIDMPLSSFIYLEDSTNVLSSKDYTVSEGSTIITLNPSYLDTLSVGKHVVKAEITGGYANLEFEVIVKAIDPPRPSQLPTTGTTISKNPQTSDNWFSGLFF